MLIADCRSKSFQRLGESVVQQSDLISPMLTLGWHKMAENSQFLFEVKSFLV